MRALIALVVLAVAAPAAADPWTDGDTFVEAGVAVTLAADYLQTRQICAHARTHPGDWRIESNPMMGPTCNRMPAEIYFPLALAAHVVIGRALPTPLRRVWQGVTIAFQINAIERNASAGFTVRW